MCCWPASPPHQCGDLQSQPEPSSRVANLPYRNNPGPSTTDDGSPQLVPRASDRTVPATPANALVKQQFNARYNTPCFRTSIVPGTTLSRARLYANAVLLFRRSQTYVLRRMPGRHYRERRHAAANATAFPAPASDRDALSRGTGETRYQRFEHSSEDAKDNSPGHEFCDCGATPSEPGQEGRQNRDSFTPHGPHHFCSHPVLRTHALGYNPLPLRGWRSGVCLVQPSIGCCGNAVYIPKLGWF